MEQAQQLYGFRPLGKRNSEWDVNNWKWDGDLFIASSVDPASVPSNFRGQQFVPVPAGAGNSLNSSSSCSDDLHAEPELGQKRRVVVVEEEEDEDEEGGTLSLKLGTNPSVGQSQVGIDGGLEGSSGKKAKVAGGSSNRPVCQVDDCGYDLTIAKDYHRRHKVCLAHSKATQAMVGNAMQRFCQQCSRFHLLQEFDEGKRSCRRRLAGHNKRRRKTQPEPVVGVQPINDEQSSSVILVSLLKMLTDIHNKPEPTINHDLVGHLTRSLASQPGSQGANNLPGQLPEYQKLQNGSLSVGNPVSISPLLASASRPPRPTDQRHSMPALETPQERIHVDNGGNMNPQAASSQKPDSIFSKDSPPAHADVRDSAVAQAKLIDFDLNDTYIDPDDGVEDLERSPPTVAFGIRSLDCRTWAQQDSQQSSPPQISGNSDSASAQSHSSSSGEDQSRTGRIVFKLFGKDPNDFPLTMRGEILEWLAHSPTELESYIRPGCVVLTIYLRLAKSVWEEHSSNLSFSLSQLLHITDDSFWQTGWIYTRVRNQVSFCNNGQIVVNTSLPSEISYCSRILSVTPIAVSMSELAHFQIKGSNFSGTTTRIVCAFEGKYLAQEDRQDETMDDNDDEIELVNFSCSIPSVTGRGFIEVEDQGLSNSFFPFIVAEKDVCSDIRTLEYVLDVGDSDEVNGRLVEARRQAMDFIHEMGWLLHRYQLSSRLRHQNPNTVLFSFKRFKCLMEFSMDHDWCAVVKKLLDIFLEGIVCPGEHPSLDVSLSEMDLLHRAVRRNSRSLVELLLHYAPAKSSGESGYGHKPSSNEDGHDFLFRPDKKGPAGLTPLHIASGTDGSEAMLDALTDDPGKVGVEAWKNVRDSTGSTPEDYAHLRGHYAYIRLVQRKVRRMSPSTESVVVDMPDDTSTLGSSKRATDGISSFDLASIASRNTGQNCNLCVRKLSYGIAPKPRIYRPAMLSIVGIAAVCVCVALLFRGSPNVDCILRPFRWESLEFGSI